MPASLRHPLLNALLFSVALHLALLLGVVHPVTQRMEIPAVRVSASLNTGVPGRPVVVSTAKPAAGQRPQASPLPETRAAHSGAPAVGQPAQEVVREVAAHPAGAPGQAFAQPAAAPGLSAPVAAGAPAQTSAGVSADDLRQYRLSLAIAARRFKRYPALARERGWEGTVGVAVGITALLPAPQVALAASSGSPVLDEQALDMVARAARDAVLPESLKGRDFRLVLPVTFSLDE